MALTMISMNGESRSLRGDCELEREVQAAFCGRHDGN